MAIIKWDISSQFQSLIHEKHEQKLFCDWLDIKHIDYYAIPNGGYRNKLEAISLSKTGVKRGVPDICIPIAMPSKGLYGAYIELKRVKNSKVSKDQQRWIEKLRANGYFAEIAYGHKEAIDLISHYLQIDVAS